IDNPPTFQIADDRSISLPALPCPVVDADDRRLHLRLVETAADGAQQCILADRHQKPASQAGRRTPAQRQPEVMHDGIEAGRTPGKCRCDICSKAFDENARTTARCGATKAPGDKTDPNRTAMSRQIGKGAVISTMHTGRWAITSWADRRPR